MKSLDSGPPRIALTAPEREFFIDNQLVRIHFIIVMIRVTGLAPWEFEFPFPGSLTSTFLGNRILIQGLFVGVEQRLIRALTKCDGALDGGRNLVYLSKF